MKINSTFSRSRHIIVYCLAPCWALPHIFSVAGKTCVPAFNGFFLRIWPHKFGASSA